MRKPIHTGLIGVGDTLAGGINAQQHGQVSDVVAGSPRVSR